MNCHVVFAVLSLLGLGLTLAYCGGGSTASAKLLLFVSFAATSASIASGQSATATPNPVEVKLTGIVLTKYQTCFKQQEAWCWGLASGHRTFLLLGDKSVLQRFVGKPVIVSGMLEQEPVEQDHLQMIRRTITVDSIESNELSEQELEEMVTRLTVVRWPGQPGQACNRGCWVDFAFTDAMVEILQAGRGAQSVLLQHLDDQSIEDQIVMLLGGIGDETAIPPIIERLTDGDKDALDKRSNRLNLVGNAALMNLTADDVEAFGTGSMCSNTLRTCWSKWWVERKASFREDAILFRGFSSYPNYGMYEVFADASLR